MDTAELRTLTQLLDLNGFEVVAMESDPAAKLRRLTVVETAVAALCLGCHKATADRHECHDCRVVDLSLGGWRTELVVRSYQFYCADCDKFFTPRNPALAPGAHATERFLERLAELATHGDVAGAARFLGIAEKTAEKWYYAYLERRRKQPPVQSPQPIRALGIDELSLKKGTASSAAC